jgi:hypothetical protein
MASVVNKFMTVHVIAEDGRRALVDADEVIDQQSKEYRPRQQ